MSATIMLRQTFLRVPAGFLMDVKPASPFKSNQPQDNQMGASLKR
jgi:hypothetical protein